MLRRLFALKSRPRRDINAITPSEAERAEALIAEQKRKNLDAAAAGTTETLWSAGAPSADSCPTC